MADRYWVGGTATWDGTAGTKWAATSGGAGGASVPTSADDVFFDAASGSVTVTVAISVNCRSMTCTGFTGTLAGTGNINFVGNCTLASGMGFTHSGAFVWNSASASATLITAGKTINTLSIGGAAFSPTVALGDALTCSATIGLNAGTFTTNNFNVTSPSLASSNSNTRTINLGSSTVTLSSSGTALTFSTSTGLTFNAGTSQITCTAATTTFSGGGQAFNNVSFTSTAGSDRTISGANVFNNLSVTGRTSAGIAPIILTADQTINGTLTLSAGTNATMRTFVRSNTIGTPRTLTCAAVASLTDIDFRDITIAGAAAPVSGTRLGDCKGNSGITFDAAKTVYWRPIGSAFWGATTSSWALSVGGTATHGAFPLAQDIAVIPDAPYPASGSIVTINAGYNIGTINMSARTSNTLTLATSTNTPTIYGNWINGTGVTLAGTGVMTFAGRGSQTITSAGKTFTQSLTFNNPNGSVTLQDAFVTSAATTTHTAGTFDANGYNFTSSGSFASAASTSTRTIAIGSGTWTFSGSGNMWQAALTGLTVTGTGTISMTSASAKTFTGGGIQTYPTINQGGTGTLTITGSNKFANITNTAIGSVLFTGGTTNDFDNFNLNGTSTAARLTLGSTNTTQAILRKPTAWNVGTGSLDNGNNTGLSFIAGTNDFLAISYINGQVTGGAILAVISETASGTDAISARVVFRSSASETATGTDTASARTIFIADINESGSATDLISALRGYFATILESASGADSVAPRYVAQPSVAETGTASDAATTRFTGQAAVAETATATEIASAGLAYIATLSETATASDVLSAAQTIFRSIAESASGTDTASARYTTSPTIAESATATDRLTAISRFVTAIAESGTATDVVSALRVLTGRVAETATASDIDSALAVFRAQIAEGLSAADAVAVAASTFNAPVVEAATVFDAPRSQAAFSATATDTATGTETVAPRYIALPQVSETATGTETVAARALFAPSIAETATISDQPRVAPSVFNAIALAVAQLSDQVSPPGSIYNAPVLESAATTDSMIGAYLWNLIDDAQTPNWGAINTAQTPVWTVADTAQPAGWAVIQNPQTPGWSTIDDSQTPGWQNTDTLN